MRAPPRIAPFVGAGIFVARSSNLPSVSEVRGANIRGLLFLQLVTGSVCPLREFSDRIFIQKASISRKNVPFLLKDWQKRKKSRIRTKKVIFL